MCQALLWVLGPTHERFHYGAYIAQWGWVGPCRDGLGCESNQGTDKDTNVHILCQVRCQALGMCGD